MMWNEACGCYMSWLQYNGALSPWWLLVFVAFFAIMFWPHRKN